MQTFINYADVLVIILPPKWCRIMDAATVTFNEAVPHPYWGMYTKKSHISHSLAERPVPCRAQILAC